MSALWKCRRCGRIGAGMWPWNVHVAGHLFGGKAAPLRRHTGDGMSTDVPAKQLADELGRPVAHILLIADDIIDGVVRRSGLDAARGLSTRPGPKGSVLLTEPLASRVRTHFA